MSSGKRVDRYSLFSRVLHWVMALLIIGMLAVGLWMQTLPKQDVQPTQLVTQNTVQKNSVMQKKESLRSQVYGWHKRIGVLLLFLFVVRLLVRVMRRDPQDVPLPFWQLFLSRWTHALLYGFMLALPLSGWLMSTYAGYPPRFFSIKVPLPFPESKLSANIYHTAHHYAAYALMGFLFLHIVGALWHYVQKDGVFRRISISLQRSKR